MKQLIITLATIVLSISLYAQSPEGFKYQAVVRDHSGAIIQDQAIGLQVRLRQGSSTGTLIYEERFNPTSNSFGLINVAIGSGVVFLGNFSSIDWSAGPYFVEIGLDLTGGNTYTTMGTNQLLSVPYALYAKTAGNGGINYVAGTGISLSGNTISNTAPDKTVTILGNGATTVTGTYPNFTINSTDQVNDADADATNEIQTITKSGNNVTLSKGGGTFTDEVEDADADTTNEIQTITKSGNNVTLSKGGGTFTDEVEDADADTTNELQNLSLSGTILSITDGNSVDISEATSSPWKETGMDIYYDEGRVAIGKNTVHPSAILEISSDNKGLLIPRMNEMQKLSLGDPAVGLLIYQTNESEGFYYYDGTGWVQLNDASSAVTKINDLSDGKSDGNGSSLFLGIDAGLNDDASDNQNIGVGFEAMKANTTGAQNTATGYRALLSNTTGNNNTATGYRALRSNTTGDFNTANGYESLRFNTTGNSNTATGVEALRLNTTGGWNTATGVEALRLNTTGGWNTATGVGALRFNTTGDFNTATGVGALRFNTTGSQNTANGYRALYSNTTGGWNTANGYRALYSNTTGSQNTANGREALHFNTTGDFNTANGSLALYSNTTGGNNTANGRSALYFNTTGDFNTATGYKALLSNQAGSGSTAIGYDAMRYANNSTSPFDANNTALGYSALRGSTTAANNTGVENTAVGAESLLNNTTGGNNTATGYRALYSNTTGENNTAVGIWALENNTTKSNNTALGYSAFSNNGNSYSNSMGLGYDAEPNGNNVVRIGNNTITTIGGYTNWTNASDGRFKTHIKEDVVGLDFVMKLRPLTYQLDMEAIATFNHTPDSLRLYDAERLKASEIQTGFIAQEVEAAAREVGYNFHGVDKPQNEKSHYGLRYAEFVVPLVKAMQEQQAIIERQGKTIDRFEKIMAQYESNQAALMIRIEQLESNQNILTKK